MHYALFLAQKVLNTYPVTFFPKIKKIKNNLRYSIIYIIFFFHLNISISPGRTSGEVAAVAKNKNTRLSEKNIKGEEKQRKLQKNGGKDLKTLFARGKN